MTTDLASLTAARDALGVDLDRLQNRFDEIGAEFWALDTLSPRAAELRAERAELVGKLNAARAAYRQACEAVRSVKLTARPGQL